MTFTKQGEFSKDVLDLTDIPSQNMQPSVLKSYFQTPADELKTTVNKLVDDLNGSGWVDTAKLGSKAVTREKVAPGAIGVNEIDPAIMNQPTTAIGVQAKLDDHTSQLASIPNQTYITEKAKTVDVNNALTLKTDKTYTDTQLTLKANQIDLNATNSTVGQKTDKTYVDTQIASVASGSPKGTYATLTALQTAFPTGNTNIYVVTADGKWYYWSGSAWTAGGVYQSTGIVDNSITTAKKTILGEYGEIICSTPYNINTSNKTIEFPTNTQVINRNKTYSGLSGTTVNATVAFQKGAYIFFNTVTNTLEIKSADSIDADNLTTVTENAIYLGTFWNPNAIGGKIVLVMNGNLNFTIDGTPYQGSYDKRTRKGEYGFLNCYYPFNIDFVNKVITFDSRGWNNVTWAGGNYDFSAATPSIPLTTTDGTGWLFFNIKTHTFTFVGEPSLSNENEILLGVIWGSNYGEKPYLNTVGGFTINSMITGLFRAWEGNTVNCLGDSITQGANTSKAYHQWLPQLNGFKTVNNYGIGGTCISTGEANDFLSRYSSMNASADVILVFGGTNDWGHHHVLGDINSTVTSTFYGALKELCNGLITKYPTKAIFFITPLQRNYTYFPADGNPSGQITNNKGNTLDQFVQAIKDVCGVYSIPVLDLYHNGFYPTNESVKSQLLTDGLHPNDAGHKIMARKISSFINSL